jgi:type I restriction enzyme S subunit
VERLKPHEGDVLYSREGGILGIACVIPKDLELCLGQRMMLFRTNDTYLGKFLMFWLNSPLILEKVKDLTGGTASPHLNVGDIKEFWSPVPPLEEQYEIVGRVELLLRLANEIERQCTYAQERVTRMHSSFLSKAFCGEFARTDVAATKA